MATNVVGKSYNLPVSWDGRRYSDQDAVPAFTAPSGLSASESTGTVTLNWTNGTATAETLVERCFGIAYRAGWLGQAPQSLAGKSFTVKYLSPMARSQMAEEVSAIQQYMGVVMQAAQIKPEAIDSLDIDEALAHVGRGLGVPATIIPTSEDLQEYREAKAQAQEQIEQQQSQSQMQGMAAQAVADRYAKGGLR